VKLHTINETKLQRQEWDCQLTNFPCRSG